jgi:hypothetical protein
MEYSLALRTSEIPVKAKFAETSPFLNTARVRPLSRPTLRRRTPIVTTAPGFEVRLDAEGAMSVRLTAQARAMRSTSRIHPNAWYPARRMSMHPAHML